MAGLADASALRDAKRAIQDRDIRKLVRDGIPQTQIVHRLKVSSERVRAIRAELARGGR